MTEIKWIKLSTEIFSDEKIRVIESMPDADAILIIWIKLLTMAGRTNAGGFIFISEDIPYTPDTLATVMGRKKSIVDLALSTFEKFGMIEFTQEGYIVIKNWERHQNVEAMERIRRLTRIRVKKHREKKKLKAGKDDVTLQQRSVTHTDIDKKKKEDKDKKEKREKIPYKEIISYLNKKAEKHFRHTTKHTQDKIRARWKEGFRLGDFKNVIDIKVSHWLKEENGKKVGVKTKEGQDLSDYLCPDTLFSASKFEKYLNQKKKRDRSQDAKEREIQWEVQKADYERTEPKLSKKDRLALMAEDCLRAHNGKCNFLKNKNPKWDYCEQCFKEAK